jgi:signal transduction histidine kinase
MFDSLNGLLDRDHFVPRRLCGGWQDAPGLVRLHLVSDSLIWLACLAIPALLLYFAWRRRVPFRGLFFMFGLFIVSCGFTHFMEVVTLYDPLYRLAGAVKLFTAVVSWATVVALVLLLPRALALRNPDHLERQIAERTAELARINLALQQARAEAEQANRAWDEFLATVSHELRTPLNSMLGWAHLLRSGGLDADTTAHGLEVLQRNTLTQARLVDDLLDINRIVTGKMRLETQPVQPAGVVEAAVKVARPAAEARQIALDVRLDDAGPVSGDPVRLQQVVWNLLSNAVKFTQPGGRVEVRLRRDGPVVELVVRDNGVGISPDFLPFVFDRFRQADAGSTRSHSGLGLGLALVRHLVEMHGGEVGAQSDGLGLGAAFTVRLPVQSLHDSQAPTNTRTTP